MDKIRPRTLDQGPVKKEVFRLSWGFSTASSEAHPEHNEDALLADHNKGIFAVFDGNGGKIGAQVASSTARDAIFNRLGEISSDMSLEQAEACVEKLAVEADNEVMAKDKANPELAGMGTTMSLVKIHQEQNDMFVIFVNIGDSRVYRFADKLEQLSTDHDQISLLNMTVESKKLLAARLAEAQKYDDLTKIEQDFFRMRNVMHQALPGASDHSPSKIKIKRGNKILITSDGIHDNLTSSEIRAILQGPGSAKDLANELVRQAKKRSREGAMRSKPDDMTAVVICID